MNTKDQNIVALCHFEVMRRVLKPVVDDIVDPGTNFNGCCAQVKNRVERAAAMVPTEQLHEYFHAKAMDALEWCKLNNAPSDFTEKMKEWADNV